MVKQLCTQSDNQFRLADGFSLNIQNLNTDFVGLEINYFAKLKL